MSLVKHGTTFLVTLLNPKMLIKSLLLNVSRIALTVNLAIVNLMPVIEPDVSIKITTSFEHVAASINQGLVRQSN